MTRWSLLLLTAIVALVGAFALISPAASSHQIETKQKPRTEKAKAPLRLPILRAEARSMWKVERSELRDYLTKSRHTLTFWRQRGLWLRATRTAKCAQVPWQRSCTIARANYKLHRLREQIALRRLQWELPNTNDWMTAVRIVQAPYPGTSGFLTRTSDDEGSRGPWVWYSGSCGDPPCLWRGFHIGGSPDVVGGWVQYRYSTFIGHWHAVVKDLAQRGYLLPDLGWARPYVVSGIGIGYGPWLSPLGQALAAGWACYHDKTGNHWGASGNYC